MTSASGSRRVAIVTGAGSGIGAATARRFAAMGWSVSLVGRRTALLEETARTVEDAGAPVLVVTADLVEPDVPHAVVQATLSRFDRVDALVNNAGIMRIEPFEESTPQAFDEVIATNLRAPYFLTQAAIPALRDAGGASVVNVGSAAASMYRPGQSIYGSSKAALEYLTKSLAVELAADGVRVNAIIPGPVDTPIHERPGVDRDAVYAALRAAIPLGRLGTSDEVAWWVAELARPEAGWVTGAIVHVDGGRVLAPPERPPTS